MISFKCTGCSIIHSAPEDRVGQRAKCNNCGTDIVVPKPAVSRQMAPTNAGVAGNPLAAGKKQGEKPPSLPKEPGLTFKCGGCGRPRRVEMKFAGARAKCVHCSNYIRIPKNLGVGDEVPTAELEAPTMDESEVSQIEMNELTKTSESPESPAGESTESRFIEELDETEQRANEILNRPKFGRLAPSEAKKRSAEFAEVIAQLETERREFLDAVGGEGALSAADMSAAREKSNRQKELLARLKSERADLVDDEPLVAEPTTAVPKKESVPPKKETQAKNTESVSENVERMSSVDDPDEGESRRRGISRLQWPIAVGILLVLGGGWLGWYMLRSPKQPWPQAKAEKKETPRVAPVVQNKNEHPPPKVTPPVGTDSKLKTALNAKEAIQISAGMLRREFEADPQGTNEKYKFKLLHVRGLFDKTDAAEKLPDGPWVFFKDSKIRCAATPKPEWKNGDPLQVLGVYQSNCILVNGEVFNPPCVGDARYRGKRIEILGILKSLKPFSFENGDTDNIVGIEPMFRPSDLISLEGLKAGMPVLLQGTCSGRSLDRKMVRLDNCVMVEAPVPAQGVIPVDWDQFVRAYEEDIRAEVRVENKPPAIEISSRQLVDEFDRDRFAAERKYFRKVVHVGGIIEPIESKGLRMILESATDRKLRVCGRFTGAKFAKLSKDATRVSFRGICNGIQGGFIMLECCEGVEVEGGVVTDGERWVTSDYFPFLSGKKQTFDELQIIGQNRNPVRRYIATHLLRGEERIEIRSIRSGFLMNGNRLEDGVTIRWGKEEKNPVLTTVTYRNEKGGVCLGRPMLIANKPATVFEPMLKTGIVRGEGWIWTSPPGVTPGLTAKASVISFGNFRGKPSLFIRKVTERDGIPVATETEHVFVKGIGEVERTTYETLPSKGLKKLVSQLRIVDDFTDPKEKDKDKEMAPEPKNDSTPPKEPKGEPSPKSESKEDLPPPKERKEEPSPKKDSKNETSPPKNTKGEPTPKKN